MPVLDWNTWTISCRVSQNTTPVSSVAQAHGFQPRPVTMVRIPPISGIVTMRTGRLAWTSSMGVAVAVVVGGGGADGGLGLGLGLVGGVERLAGGVLGEAVGLVDLVDLVGLDGAVAALDVDDQRERDGQHADADDDRREDEDVRQRVVVRALELLCAVLDGGPHRGGAAVDHGHRDVVEEDAGLEQPEGDRLFDQVRLGDHAVQADHHQQDVDPVVVDAEHAGRHDLDCSSASWLKIVNMTMLTVMPTPYSTRVMPSD